jgi:hypothetical protein
VERLVSIGSYDPTAGLHLEWSDGFEIEVQVHSGEVLIRANKAGLVSLAQHLLTLGAENWSRSPWYGQQPRLLGGSCRFTSTVPCLSRLP